MSAPDLQTLYAFEDNFEAAWKTILETEGMNVLTQRDDATIATPYVAIQFRLGEATGHKTVINSEARPSGWRGELEFQLVTDRQKDLEAAIANSNYGEHRELIKKLRALVADWQNQSTTAVLPYYFTQDVLDAGTTPATDAGEEFDISAIKYSLHFAIYGDAWP